MTVPNALRSALQSRVQELGQRAFDAWRKKDFSVELKGEIDPVTEIDSSTEELLIEFFAEHDPNIPVVGEESFDGMIPAECWIVDPIDGTVNFATGHPMFTINIVRVQERRPIYALTHAPAMSETFWASEGEGAWLNGTRVQVARADSLQHAVGATGFPYWLNEFTNVHNNIDAFEAIVKRCRAVRRGGCASLDLAYVAAGRFAFFWEPGLKPWDIVAGMLLVREAGGVVCGYDGKELRDWFSPIVACEPALQSELTGLLEVHDIQTQDLPYTWLTEHVEP